MLLRGMMHRPELGRRLVGRVADFQSVIMAAFVE